MDGGGGKHKRQERTTIICTLNELGCKDSFVGHIFWRFMEPTVATFCALVEVAITECKDD